MPDLSSMPSSHEADLFSDRLLSWWDSHGRKNLPWQIDRNPYRVWVSEIMLQQTQVATVIDYFQRWMQRFPDLEALALASEDEVMQLWSGLGYYSRARNIHKTAKICAEHFKNQLPDTPEALTELPGIGPSTANAIVSLALDQPAAILDGNVKRVLARHAGIDGWPGKSAVMKKLWHEAEIRLPGQRAADYSQAIMDLGAMVCTPKKPECEDCPLSPDCRAKAEGTIDEIPGARPKRKVQQKTIRMLLIVNHDHRVLLQRRPPSGVWGGLWSLPERNPDCAITAAFENQLDKSNPLPAFKHRLTHMLLRIEPEVVLLDSGFEFDAREIRDKPHLNWFSSSEWEQLGLPQPVKKLLNGKLSLASSYLKSE